MAFLKKVKIKPEVEASEPTEVPTSESKKWLQAEGKLTIDLYETNSSIVLQTAIAGVRPEDFNISIENDVLEIQGTRSKPEETKSKKNYFFQECYWGPFSRKVILPKEVDNSRTKASIKEGVLTIKIPKLERERKRRIRLGSKKK